MIKNTEDKAGVTNIFNDLYMKLITGEIRSRDELHRAKVDLCRTFKLDSVPSNSEILENAPEHIYEMVLPLLLLKPMRTRSGVAPVAVMTSPEECPHGKCSYCPGGVKHGTAQSYTGHEPAAMRAGAHSFGPYHQVVDRLKQLEVIGHPTDKIDLIIMGGTFSARSDEYQTWFIKRCFDGLNGKNSKNLIEAHSNNEDAPHRCIGLTFETRPDECSVTQVAKMLNMGGTRVELGVQTLDDDVLKLVQRGHGSSETRVATALLKDAGLKVCYHLMPNLPGMNPASDLDVLFEVFENPEYRPDMIKIYPTLVVKGTGLYDVWKKHEYKPYSLDDTIELIARLKTIIPPWVRIQRVQRDIPAKLIEAGVKFSNLRQLVHNRLDELGERCRCIRCREVGQNLKEGMEPDEDSFEILTEEYDSSGGTEVFISLEDRTNDLIIAFLRLRKPGSNRLLDLDQPSFNARASNGFALVRELKVFGQLVSIKNRKDPAADKTKINSDKKYQFQHKGYGTALMDAAAAYAREKWDIKLVLVNSGVGARLYYKKLGYTVFGHYMARF